MKTFARVMGVLFGSAAGAYIYPKSGQAAPSSLPGNLSRILKILRGSTHFKNHHFRFRFWPVICISKNKKSGILKPNHSNLQFLCLCDNIDNITGKVIRTHRVYRVVKGGKGTTYIARQN